MLSLGRSGEELVVLELCAAGIRERMVFRRAFSLSDRIVACLGSKSIPCRCTAEARVARELRSPTAQMVCRKGDMKAAPKGLKCVTCFASVISSDVNSCEFGQGMCS